MMPLPPPPRRRLLAEGKIRSNIKNATETEQPAPPAPAQPKAEPLPEVLREWAERKRQARVDSNWKTIADVDWEDLEHFVARARHTKDNVDFDTCVRILEALRKQILTK